MRDMRWGVVALAGVLAVVLLGAVFGGPVERIPLKELYTPHFAAMSFDEPAAVSAKKFASWLFSAEGLAAVQRLLPTRSGALWVSLIVALVVGFDFQNIRNPRNLDLLAIEAVGWLFFDILGFFDRMRDPTSRNVMDWVFTGIVALTMLLLVRAVLRVYRPFRAPWAPAAQRRTLAALAIVLLGTNVAIALAYPPDDAGYFVNIGAQRLRERLRFPYGDPLLTATPAAAYGPILYLAHIPFQIALSPKPVNPVSPARPPIESANVYFEPPILATKLCNIAFQLLAAAALFAAVARLRGPTVAWALVALYCGSAFVLGVGGEKSFIGGITFVSHIAPAAVTLLAFALLERPAWSGAMLAAGVGVLFYPIFFVPAWLGYYWKEAAPRRQFIVGFAIAALVIGASVYLLSRPAGGKSRIATIVSDTLGHQESPEAYGSSPFGFWGQRQGLRAWLMTPLVAPVSISRPVVLAFFVFAAAMFLVARGRSAAELALVTAAVAMGAQLWKIHATGTYVNWYYPFLLIGLFCSGPRPKTTDADV